MGSAVGLGNLWRFPYLAGKYGGGAFLIPYLIALVLVGVPLLMLELAVGQKMQQGAIGSYQKLHPSFGALGALALISSFIIVSYYAQEEYVEQSQNRTWIELLFLGQCGVFHLVIVPSHREFQL